VLLSVRRLGGKRYCDSNAAVAAHKALAAARGALVETSAIEDLAAEVPSSQCRGSKSSNYLSCEGFDQMLFVPEGARPSRRAPSKHVSAADFDGVQDTLRQRRGSDSMVMRDVQAEHGATTVFPPLDCPAVTHGVDMTNHSNHPSQGQLAAKPRRRSKAGIDGSDMPLNMVGRHVVQLEASRSACKTASGARVTPRRQLNHLPHLEDLVIFGSSHEEGARAERCKRRAYIA